MTIPEPTSLLLAITAGTLFGLACIPHCFAMCGPLHLTMCLAGGKRSFWTLSLFNLGRIAGYTVIGALCGFLGNQLEGVFGKGHRPVKIEHVQVQARGKEVAPAATTPHETTAKPGKSAKFSNPRRYLMFLFPAGFMLLLGVKGILAKASTTGAAKEGWISQLFKKMQRGGPVACGAAASLLPCGVLYAAFAIAVSTMSALMGAALLLAYCVTITFFLQLGIMVGTSVGRRFGPVMNRVFPWLALGASGVYVLLFIFK